MKGKKLWSFDKASDVLIKTKIEILGAVKNVYIIFEEEGELVLNSLQKRSIGASFG